MGIRFKHNSNKGYVVLSLEMRQSHPSIRSKTLLSINFEDLSPEEVFEKLCGFLNDAFNLPKDRMQEEFVNRLKKWKEGDKE